MAMNPKVQTTSPISDSRFFVWCLGQVRLCARGAVRGADLLPLAAQGHRQEGAAALGGRAGRLWGIKPLQDPMAFPASLHREGAVVTHWESAGTGGGVRTPWKTLPRCCQGQAPPLRAPP